MPNRIGVRPLIVKRISLSVVLPDIGTKVVLAAVILADTSLGVMVVVSFRAGRRSSADRLLRSN